ncbi:hypothetical protein GCM10010411_77020 [Actinomadura fulvescens]|uniref:Uncharacterized protein n=1 Tax=Actinomadura fulvescens TaxID=46160 RepID=A0ABP6CUH1_9ACTN
MMISAEAAIATAVAYPSRAAKEAADATGDLELQLGIRATETGDGLKGQRRPAVREFREVLAKPALTAVT